MARFVDRQKELHELDEIVHRRTAQLVIVYGRRRVGKTTLLLEWARQTQVRYLYWVARRETPDACRHNLARALWQWAYPHEANPEPPRFELWSQLFEQMARMLGDSPVVVIFDEFPYALESDPSFASNLQAAWDHLFKAKPITLILAGSHIGMMVEQLDYRAPLYGRITAQLEVDPLPFAALSEFFPSYPAAERVATYAVLGGVPAYLEWFDEKESLSTNVRRHLFRRAGMFRSEPAVLISDLVRETRTYESVLRAIATGSHTPADIAVVTGLTSSNLPPYLARLRDLGLIERRLPAVMPADQRRTTKRSRYHLRDPYLRFYFRFIEPNLDLIEQELTDVLWDRISEQFRAFVGLTAFEDLCREWTLAQARSRRLPLTPELVGSHWAQDVQVDVVAINWRERAILLGECKWAPDQVDRSVIRELAEKVPKVVPGTDWQVSLAYFARSGFTEAARSEAQKTGALLVTLEKLDSDLRDALGAKPVRQ